MKLFALLLLTAYTSAQVAPRIEQCKIDLAMVVDASGSIYQDGTGTEANWVAIKNFLEAIVSSFIIGPDQAQVGLVKFASDAMVEWNLNQYQDINSLVNRIRGLTHPNGGTTHAEEALQLVLSDIFVPGQDRPDAVNVVFFVTDGKPNPYNEASFNSVLNQVRGSVYDFVGVAVGNAIDEDIMALIDSDFISVNDFNGLADIVANVADRACQQVTTTAGPPPTCPEPTHTIFFSAWSTDGNEMFDDGYEMMFSGVETNMGGGYDGYSRFYCPCDGYYEFHLTMSGVDFGMGAMIMRNEEAMNPMAYLQYGQGNAMSTTAIFSCYEGDYVWASVIMTHAKNPMMPCMIDGHALMGFTGKLITTF